MTRRYQRPLRTAARGEREQGKARLTSGGAPLPGLCACALADRGATKALKEEGKTQAKVAARVSTGFVTE